MNNHTFGLLVFPDPFKRMLLINGKDKKDNR